MFSEYNDRLFFSTPIGMYPKPPFVISNLTPQLLNHIPQQYPLYLSVLLGLILSYKLNERGCF